MAPPLIALTLAFVGAAAPLQSPQSSPAGAAMTRQTASADATFVKKLAQGDLAEVDAGRLASQKAKDPDVKAFGEHMVSDHSKNSSELETLAKDHGLRVPTTIDKEHAAAKTKLNAASDAHFDSEYIKGQVRDHEKTVRLLQSEIESGQEQSIKDFAQKTLPVVQHHLAMAKQLQGKLPAAMAKRSTQ